MKKNYPKGYGILQITIFFAIITFYLVYIVVGAGPVLDELLTPTMIHSIALLLFVLQIQTLLDIYNVLNVWVDLIFSLFIAFYAAYLAFMFHIPAIHIGFTIVLAVISFSTAIQSIQRISEIRKGRQTKNQEN